MTSRRLVLRTSLCDLLGIEYPMAQSGMGLVAGPDLVAEVSRAGGLGIVAGFMQTADQLRAAVREVRAKTDRPFGLNVWLPPELRPPVPAGHVSDATVRLVQAALPVAVPGGRRRLPARRDDGRSGLLPHGGRPERGTRSRPPGRRRGRGDRDPRGASGPAGDASPARDAWRVNPGCRATGSPRSTWVATAARTAGRAPGPGCGTPHSPARRRRSSPAPCRSRAGAAAGCGPGSSRSSPRGTRRAPAPSRR